MGATVEDFRYIPGNKPNKKIIWKPFWRPKGLSPEEYKRLYQLFMESDEWKDLAKQVKARSDFTCELCGYDDPSIKDHLICHHLTYKWGWLCPMKYLLCVCPWCHRKLHPQ